MSASTTVEVGDTEVVKSENMSYYCFKIPLDAEKSVVPDEPDDGVYVAWHSDDDIANDTPVTGAEDGAEESDVDFDSYAWVHGVEIVEE